MTGPPPSIPECLNKLEHRMQRIEDAITAKGIKFVDKRKEYDWIPVAKVMDYVFEVTGVKRTHWRGVYYWISPGLVGKHGKRVKLKYETITFRRWYTREKWVRDFLGEL